jgi:DNA (cytosine-5)-methyltransferase 1
MSSKESEMKMGKKKGKKFTFIDLFAGCGGLTEGFLQSRRFKALAHIEWEWPMVETLRNRLVQKWGYSERMAARDVVHFDVQKTEELLNGHWSEDSIKKYGATNHKYVIDGGLRKIVGARNVDLIIGGPPCQAYSIHGRAQDKDSMQNDYRNYLFESFVKVVDAFRPKVFVFENVTGMLSAKPGGVHVTERIYDAFANIGYDIRQPNELSSAVFDAVDFQVPQFRRRVIILGIRRGSGFDLDDLYAAISRERSKKPYKTVRDAIGNLPRILPLDKPIKGHRANISHKVIQTDLVVEQHLPRYHAPREVGVFRDWIVKDMNHASHQEQVEYYYNATGHTTLYTKYKNLTWDKPSHTVVAHLSKDGMMFIHPDSEQARSITIREAALLMTFPVDFRFYGSNPYCFKMIGNAVPVNLAKGIAKGLAKELERETK